MISCFKFLMASKNSSFSFSKKTVDKKNHKINFKSFFGGDGGNGKNNGFKTVYNEDPDNFFGMSLFFFMEQKKNHEFNVYNERNYKCKKQKNNSEEIILKNCELIPEPFLCINCEDLFYQDFLRTNNLVKVEKCINNWYTDKNYKFSEIQKSEKLTDNENFSYFFQTREPKIKSFKVCSDLEKTEKKFLNISSFRTILLLKILNISFGQPLKFNLDSWNRIRLSDGVKVSQFSIKDQDLGDFGTFLDVTLKINKVGSLAVEPEISLIDNELSSSLSFSEKNVLNTGISIKQKIFFKKFSPYYMKFEIDDKKLRKLQNVLVLGKYIKDFFSIGVVFKKIPNDIKTGYIKISSGTHFLFSKNSLVSSFNPSSLEFSLVASNLKFLKSHVFFTYFSLDRFSKIIEPDIAKSHVSSKNSLILNSILEPIRTKAKLKGLVVILENRLDMINSFEHAHKNNINIGRNSIEKYISVNTIVSKNLKVFLYLKDKNRFSFNRLKKIGIGFELGRIFSFSFSIGNLGKTKILFNN
jgi:hypothetical protein